MARVEQLSNDEYTRTLDSHVIQWSQGPATLGHETMFLESMQRKGESPYISQSRRRDKWRFKKTKLGCLVFDSYILSTTTKRALKHLMNPEPYYHYPRIESSYRTCDSLAD